MARGLKSILIREQAPDALSFFFSPSNGVRFDWVKSRFGSALLVFRFFWVWRGKGRGEGEGPEERGKGTGEKGGKGWW